MVRTRPWNEYVLYPLRSLGPTPQPPARLSLYLHSGLTFYMVINIRPPCWFGPPASAFHDPSPPLSVDLPSLRAAWHNMYDQQKPQVSQTNTIHRPQVRYHIHEWQALVSVGVADRHGLYQPAWHRSQGSTVRT